jgi:uncharacterized protein with von Willebrand factor type A (vWA) domain
MVWVRFKLGAAEAGRLAGGPHAGVMEPANDLSTNVAAFCGMLRTAHGFDVGHREAHDALRAIEAVGVADYERVRSALRLVCCATHAQTLTFDGIFDGFFRDLRRGAAQTALAPRHTRPGREQPDAATRARRAASELPGDDRDDAIGGTAGQRGPDRDDGAAGWQLQRARYSPAAGRGTPLEIDFTALDAMRAAADRLVRSVRLGRSRRWKAMAAGSRFDLRRTLRGSLATGCDPVVLRMLGHPFRNPRFVVLVDGSRSMAEHTAGILSFAAALCDRAEHASVFVFSTGLRDVTRLLQARARSAATFADLGEAWGGGTRIGANLARFVDDHGARLLSRETLVIVFSDGLDVGDVPQLARAMREIDRRSAGIVWLNPHAESPGFAPAARGMRAALPFITLLCAASDAAGFIRLARRITQTPRIRGRN